MSFFKLQHRNNIAMPKAKPVVAKEVEEAKKPEEINDIMMFESCSNAHSDADNTDADMMLEMAMSHDMAHTRAECMSAVIEWTKGEGTYDDLYMLAFGIADIDEDGEIQDGEE